MRRRLPTTMSASASLTPDDVAAIWRRIIAGFTPTEVENQTVVSRVSFENATALIVFEQEEERKRLTEAHRLLTAWCARHEDVWRSRAQQWINDGVDPKLVLSGMNHSVSLLAQGLKATRDLVRPLPSKRAIWANTAIVIWHEAKCVLTVHGRKTGKVAGSCAIQFTYEVLVQLGYAEATQHAVSHVIREFSRRCV